MKKKGKMDQTGEKMKEVVEVRGKQRMVIGKEMSCDLLQYGLGLEA